LPWSGWAIDGNDLPRFPRHCVNALHEAGFDEKYIEAQLAHQKRNKTSAAYNHAAYLPQRAQMMQAWADIWDNRAKQPKAQAAD
jgi:integrase